MAVTTDPKLMLEQVRSAVEFCAKFTDQGKKLVQRFVGNHYCTGMRTEPAPENLLLSFQASIVPQLAFDNPQVQVKSQRPVTGGDIAKWMQQGLNQWIQVRDIVDDLERAAVDSLYSYGVFKVGIEPVQQHSPEPGVDEVEQRMIPHLPFLVHVPNTDYCFDPECKKWEYRRWEAMRLIRDLEDVQNDPQYGEAERQQVVAAWQAQRDSSRVVSMPRNSGQTDRVELWEVYYLETGQIGILCETGKGGATWLKPLQKHYGPGSPYVLVGGYYVPGSPIPCSILVAVADQFNELNAHATAAGREEASRKSIGLIDAGAKEAKAIKAAKNGEMLTVEGFTGKVSELVIGGTTPERLNFISFLRDRCDRIMGQSDAIRGAAVGGDKTATEVSISQDNANIRVQLLQRHWRRAVRSALEKAAWYMFNDPMIVFPVAMDDPATGKQGEGFFIGGVQPGQEDLNWTHYHLSIEPLSMQRVDPQRQAQIAQMVLDVAMTVAPMIPQFPWIKWRTLLDQLGEAHNIEGFASMLMDENALVQAMVLGMVPPIPPGQQVKQNAELPPNANPQLRMQMGQGGGMGAGTSPAGTQSGPMPGAGGPMPMMAATRGGASPGNGAQRPIAM